MSAGVSAGCALLLESAALNKAHPELRHAYSSRTRRALPLQARRRAQEDEDYVELDDEDGWSQVRMLCSGGRARTLWSAGAQSQDELCGWPRVCSCTCRNGQARSYFPEQRAGRGRVRYCSDLLTSRCAGAWQGSSGLQPVLRQVWAAASRAVDGLVDVAEDYVPENVSRGTVRCPRTQVCLQPLAQLPLLRPADLPAAI